MGWNGLICLGHIPLKEIVLILPPYNVCSICSTMRLLCLLSIVVCIRWTLLLLPVYLSHADLLVSCVSWVSLASVYCISYSLLLPVRGGRDQNSTRSQRAYPGRSALCLSHRPGSPQLGGSPSFSLFSRSRRGCPCIFSFSFLNDF